MINKNQLTVINSGLNNVQLDLENSKFNYCVLLSQDQEKSFTIFDEELNIVMLDNGGTTEHLQTKLIGANFKKHFPAHIVDFVMPFYHKALNTECVEFNYTSPIDGISVYKQKIIPLLNSKSVVSGIIHSVQKVKFHNLNNSESLIDINKLNIPLENTKDFVFICELTQNASLSNFIYVNDNACKAIDCHIAKLITISPFTLFPEIDSFKMNQIINETLHGKFKSVETSMQTHDKNKKISVELHTSTVNIEDKTFFYFIANDITSRKQAEENLYISEEKFRLAFMTSLDAFYLATFDTGEIIEINDVFVDLFGYTKEESIGKTSLELNMYFNPDDRAKMLEKLHRDGFVKDMELLGRRKNGEQILVSLSTSFYVMNNIKYIIGSVRDITKRKQEEEKLRQSENYFHKIIDTIQTGIVICDLDAKIKYGNSKAYELLGVNDCLLVGESIFNSGFNFLNEDGSFLLDKNFPVSLSIHNKKSVRNSIIGIQRTKKNDMLWLLLNSDPIFKDDGSFDTVICTFKDLTEIKQSQDKINESEEKFRSAFMVNRNAFYLGYFNDGKIIEVNQSFQDIFGYSKDEVIGKNLYEVGIYNDETAFHNLISNITENGFLKDYEIIASKKNGEKLIVAISSKQYELNGQSYFISSASDITERKNAIEALNEFKMRLELAMKAANMAWWEMSVETGLVTFDDRKAEMLGYEPSMFKHYMDFVNLVHPDDKEKAMNAMRRHFSGEAKNYEVEYRIKCADGNYKWFYDNGAIVKSNSEGLPLSVAGLVMDIDARKSSENALRKSEENYRYLFENHSAIKMIFDPTNGNIIHANKAAADYYGWDTKQLAKMNIHDINVLSNEVVDENMKITKANKSAHFELKHKRADGGIKDVEVFSTATILGGKEYIHSIIIDIGERKKAEEKVLKLSRFYNFISKVNQLIIYSTDDKFLFEKVCKIAVDSGKFKMAWIGIPDTRSDAIIPLYYSGDGSNYLNEISILKNENTPEGKGPTAFALNEGKYMVCNNIEEASYMAPWKAKAREYGYASSIAIPVKNENKVVAVFSLYAAETDFFDKEETELLLEVTKNVSFAIENLEKEKLRKIANEKLAQDEASIRILSVAIEQSPVTTIITDIEGKIVYVNPKFTETSGYLAMEVIGKTPRILKSGLKSKDEYKDLWSRILSGESWQGEFHNMRKDGTLYWEKAIISPVKNEHGVITNFLAVKEDITELKNSNSKLEHQNMELKKTNYELDRFVYSTSHELRSPLASIMGLYSLLNLKTIGDDNLRIIELINRSIVRMDETLRDILNYSRNARNELKVEKIDFENIIENAFINNNYIDANFVFDKRIRITKKYEFYSDASRLKIIFNNLISNCLKYKNKSQPKSFIEVNVDVDENKMILQVKDNGLGIENKYHTDIFKMFFRATTESSGSGLGLYILKECVDNLMGKIHLESKILKGTNIIIEIPNSKIPNHEK